LAWRGCRSSTKPSSAVTVYRQTRDLRQRLASPGRYPATWLSYIRRISSAGTSRSTLSGVVVVAPTEPLAPGVPVVLLLEVDLPGISAVAGMPLLVPAAPSTKVVVWTVFDDQEKVFRALCAGAAGYLLKTATMEEISEAVREVLAYFEGAGRTSTAKVDKWQARDVLHAIHLASRGLHVMPPTSIEHRDVAGPELLTPREADVLELLQSGRTNAEIAQSLHVSVETVRTHARRVYRKLGVRTRRELRPRRCATRSADRTFTTPPPSARRRCTPKPVGDSAAAATCRGGGQRRCVPPARPRAARPAARAPAPRPWSSAW